MASLNDAENDKKFESIFSEEKGQKKILENISKFPRYGWKVTFDHKFPEKRDQQIRPRLMQLPQLMPLFIRYFVWYLYTRYKGRKPWIDCITMLNGKQIYGVPLGGIGNGTIGRGFKGEFCRYQMIPGIYEYNIVYCNQFLVTIRDPKGNTLYQKVLSPYTKSPKGLEAWDWGFNGEDGFYCGLYPRSWTVYNIKEQRIRLICRQVSPIIPHNYKDTSLPVGVFIWTIENNNEEPRDISITLTFKNGTGGTQDKFGECWTESFDNKIENDKVEEEIKLLRIKGVVLHQTLRNMNLKYCVAAKQKPGVSVSYCTGFDPLGSGESIWNDLKVDGELDSSNLDPIPKTKRGEEIAVAVCGKCSVSGSSNGTLEISVSWHMPNIVFKGGGQTYTKRYTRWFGVSDSAAMELTCYALQNYVDWECQIEDWQNPILNDPNLPDWFKSALFNELYFISDGGSLWLEMPSQKIPTLSEHDPRIEYGRFAYLESHEYRMYNSYDVHFYASWALALLWPFLQKVLQYDLADWTITAQLKSRRFLFNGEKGVRKVANSVPHDCGDPEDEPFERINAYQTHDVSKWKDLNLKFVLMVLRDYQLNPDMNYLLHMWPVCRTVIDASLAHDRDGDGLIENDGRPDQTYDSWTMHGPSAYCGSLWLAALAAMNHLARELKDKEEEEKFHDMLVKAKVAMFDKLWTGNYFKFDSCNGSHSKSIMADQLVGHWYLVLSGITTQVFGHDCVHSILKLLYEKNVLNFFDGEMGAVNGMYPDGSVDYYTMQSEEVWTGVTYSLAATMIYEGMTEQGFKTAEGIYRTVYEKIGQGYETPEALFGKSKYRAIGYMRPLSIWSMYHAYELRQKQQQQQQQNNDKPV